MRDHNKAFCRLVAEMIDCPAPVFEFGSYQVEGQEGYANLRALFPGKEYVGCDMRPGPGVDRVEDVTAIRLPDHSAGTVLCVETFEHVFEVRRAFDEVHRILKPGGVFVITSPLNFRIHGYPDDYWRMTPSCLRRMLEPYGARASGFQGYRAFPHTVMGVGIKAPIPADGATKLSRLVLAYCESARGAEAALPVGAKLRRLASRIYRSKGERRQVADYYAAEFHVDVEAASQRERERVHETPIHTAA
jgi:SAM-dependent methyltransferase